MSLVLTCYAFTSYRCSEYRIFTVCVQGHRNLPIDCINYTIHNIVRQSFTLPVLVLFKDLFMKRLVLV